MKKFNLIIDVAKCEDCNNCFLACKDEFLENNFPGYAIAQPRHGQRWMNIMRKERGQFPLIDVAYRPTPCMHCDQAPCIAKGKDGAVYKRDDGIVMIDPAKAKGQKGIVESCPYGAIWWNEEAQTPQKCILCAHLLSDGWTKTRCTQVCPTGALQLVHLEDAEMEKMVRSEGLEVLHPEYKTKPRVYYKNLYRYDKCFIAGSLAVKVNGLMECAAGAEVALLDGSGRKIGQATSDEFGDFKFDNLPENSGRYVVEVAFAGRDKRSVEVTLTQSVNAGTIEI